MKWLSDAALDRLRAAADIPDLSDTRYVLVDKLGEGGMGGVYRVLDKALDRQVALKAIRVMDSSGELAARLLHEAKIIARLEHPGIVPVHDVGVLPDDRVFYTMELVQGQGLDQYAAGSFPIPERLRIFQKICEAVAFAHAHGVLHRDLKPQNIMVGKFGEVLVMDWGLAKVLNAEIVPDARGFEARKESCSHEHTSHGAVLGTPGYMAPEQARGEIAAVGPRADVYSLGAVLKFLLGGTDSTPKALAAIVAKAMAEPLGERYGSVEALASDIALYLDGLPVSAYPERSITRVWRWAVRNRAWILLVVAYLVMRSLFIWWRGR